MLSLVSLVSSSARCMAIISESSTNAKSLILMVISSSLCITAHQLNHRYSTCCNLVETGCILVISVSVFPFRPESSISYICMVVVTMERCRLFVVVLVPPIVLIRVSDIPVSQWSIRNMYWMFCVSSNLLV